MIMMMLASLSRKRLLLGLYGSSKSHSIVSHHNHVAKSLSSSSTLSPAKKPVPESVPEHSFTVSYLMKSCGLSSEKALSASKKVHFESSLRPDSVLELLRNNGFAEAQISKLVEHHPDLLLAKAEKTLVPKLRFLRSVGVSDHDIARLMSHDPRFLQLSLTKYIIPKYNFFKSLVGAGREGDIFKAFMRSRGSLEKTTQSIHVVRNMNVLRELGTPESSVVEMITKYNDAAFLTHELFKEASEYLKANGFNPGKIAFLQAIHVISSLGKTSLEEKFNIYSRWGWSEEDAISAFSQPYCMVFTEKRITGVMDFLVNKMGYSSKLIAACPIVLCFSLERRIIPRCLVARVLLYKGLIKKDISLSSLLQRNEKLFLRNYVIKFQDKVSQLRDVYDGKVDIGSLGISLKD